MPSDLGRIRFVTRHFLSLQGLTLAVIPLPTLCGLWILPLRRSDPLEGLLLSVLHLILMLLGLWLGDWLRGYYLRRFGALRDESGAERMLPWAVVFGVAMLADSIRIGAGAGGPSATLLAAAALGVWRAARGWPWRAHQLILAAVMTAAVVALPLPGPQRAYEPYVRQVFTLLFGSLAVCAVLDHRLLVRTLRPGPETAGDDEGVTPEEWA